MKNFTFLSALLVCVLLTSITVSEELLPLKAKDWKYYDGEEDPGKDWMKADFDDSKWKSGQAIFGYGDDDEKTKISFGDDKDNKRTCAFFRRVVDVEDPNSFKGIIAKLVCDDGAVVYINGEEVHRHNVAEGEIKPSTMAQLVTANRMERMKMPFVVDTSKLKAGKNTIAVRVHQVSKSSSDLAFDFSLEGANEEEKIEQANEIAKQISNAIAEALKQQENENLF